MRSYYIRYNDYIIGRSIGKHRAVEFLKDSLRTNGITNAKWTTSKAGMKVVCEHLGRKHVYTIELIIN